MNKRILIASVLSVMALTLGAFQNCSSSLPSNATNNSSSAASVSNQTGCTMDGALISSGTVETGYVQAVASGAACPAAQTLTCTNGYWYGASAVATTGVSTGSDGEGSSTAYASAYSTCVSENQSCSAAGTTLASGATMTAYSASTVPYGSSCTSVAATLSCSNGVVTSSTGLASSYTSSTCAPAGFSGHYNQTGSISTPSYSDPTIYGIPPCPGNTSGAACSSSGAQCFINFGGYYAYNNVYTTATCQ